MQLIEQPTRSRFAKAVTAVAAAMIALTVSACGALGDGGNGGTGILPAENETVHVFNQSDAAVDMTLTYYAVGDVVTKQTTVNVINYQGAGLADADAARALLDPLIGGFQNVVGLEHSIVYGDTSATETLAIDYNIADIVQISELTGSTFEGVVDSNTRLSLAQSRQMLLASGFTEVK